MRIGFKDIILAGTSASDKILTLSSPTTPPASPSSRRSSLGSGTPDKPDSPSSESPTKSKRRNARLITKCTN
jgi:hypothetical protein